MSEYVKEVNEGDFDQVVLKSKTPALVDFWAQWCGPCRELAPTVEAIAEQYGDAARVFKLNVDDSPAVAQRYGIQGIPTLILSKMEWRRNAFSAWRVRRKSHARLIGTSAPL
jgi:thioredoxin 1